MQGIANTPLFASLAQWLVPLDFIQPKPFA